MNAIRAAKYAVRAASLVVSALILVVVAGPIIGAVSPQFMTQQRPLGIGVDLQSVQSQLQFFSSGSTITGAHDVVVPAFNNWPLPGGASLYLTLMVNGQTIYQTQPASIHLDAFQSGDLHISMDVSPGLATQLQGQNIGVGGAMSVSEDQFWSITVSFPQK